MYADTFICKNINNNMISIPITFLFWTSNIFCFRQCEYICISSFFIKLSLIWTSHVKNRLTSYSFETAPSDVKCIEIIVVCDISFIIQQTKHQFAWNNYQIYKSYECKIISFINVFLCCMTMAISSIAIDSSFVMILLVGLIWRFYIRRLLTSSW